jgi:uncharacterized protein YndB with AHSA1/START domain
VADVADPVVRTIDVSAAPETVFEFFVDADKLKRWLVVDATVDPRPGGVCIQQHRGDDRAGGPFPMHGTYLEVDPPHRVVFTWGFTHPEIGVPPGSTIVEVTFEAIDDEPGPATRVTLVHRNLPPAAAGDHAAGWAQLLDVLARVLAQDAAPGPAGDPTAPTDATREER